MGRFNRQLILALLLPFNTHMSSLPKVVVCILVLGSSFGSISAQKNHRIPKTIDQVIKLIETYDTLSPFSDYEDSYLLIDSLNRLIPDLLIKLLSDPKYKDYPFMDVLPQNSLSISSSKDGKIQFYSLDEKTGGTYRPSITILRYRKDELAMPADYFNNDGVGSSYGDVYLLDSLNGVYFVIGGVRTCSACIHLEALLLTINQDGVSSDLLLSYDGRDVEDFSFDENTQTFSYSYSYYTDDPLYPVELVNDEKIHTYSGILQYINGAFKLIEECETLEY